MIIPNIWENEKWSKPSTSIVFCCFTVGGSVCSDFSGYTTNSQPCFLLGLRMFQSSSIYWYFMIFLQGGAPPVISWLIIPLTIDISSVSPSYYWSYKPTKLSWGHHLVLLRIFPFSPAKRFFLERKKRPFSASGPGSRTECENSMSEAAHQVGNDMFQV